MPPMSLSTSVASIVDATKHLPDGATLIVHDVPWEDYERLLVEFYGRLKLRATYDRGWLQIVSTSNRHERYAATVESLILICSDTLDLTVEGTGRATWKRRLLARGVEADASYYVRNAGFLFESRELDIEVDPPPDLVVEIDLTNDSRRKFSVYAALGVPEIWRYDGAALQILRLVEGRYVQFPDSLSFPGLGSALLTEAIEISKSESQTAARQFLKRKLQGA
jgi:Uma2 family endonuclease